jgi:hypothetical protein
MQDNNNMGGFRPKWKEGVNDNIKHFIMKLLDPNMFNRTDKSTFLNHDYALQSSTPSQVIAANRVLTQNIPHIYEIYANECFVEAFLAYLSVKINDKKLMNKLREQLKLASKPNIGPVDSLVDNKAEFLAPPNHNKNN